MYSDMPHLVDPFAARDDFIPPPPLGQPVIHDAFPGLRGGGGGEPSWLGHGGSSPWGAQGQSPWPTFDRSPQWGASDGFSDYNNPTPAGTWGHPTPASSWGVNTPLSAYPSAPPQEWWPPEDTLSSHMHASRYLSPANEDAFGQPISASPWFGGGSDGGFGRSSSGGVLVRSNSFGGPRPDSRALVRSNSFGGGGGGLAGSGIGLGRRHGHRSGHLSRGEYNEENPARRPKDWRESYTARPGIASILPRFGKNRSNVQEITDSVRRSLHTLLLYNNPTSPPLVQDLRLHPFQHGSLSFPILYPRRYNELDLCQFACTPPAEHMRLFHPRLPWYVDIVARHSNGITIQDVIEQLFEQLHHQISGKHYWNEELGIVERARLGEAFQERCAVSGVMGEDRNGIRRVDFLGKKFLWEGLVRTRTGMWEIKTKKIDR